MASPLETPLQEVEGEGRVLRGDEDLARSTSPGDCLPSSFHRPAVLQAAVMECAPDSSCLPH